MTRSQPHVPLLSGYLLTLFGVALLALGIHDVFGAHGYLAMRRSEQQIEQLRGEIDRLNRQNQELTQDVNALKTDPAAIEKIAREEMGLARPGEMIFKMPAAASAEGQGAPPAASR